MKKYLSAVPDIENRDFVSCLDELPLWSAPFGLSLLEKINMKAGMKVLDVGCGLGFPLLEIAQRLGNTCRVTGIDPWETALERIRLKIKENDIANADVLNSTAESMPFKNCGFNLIVSNNGLNNVQDLERSIKECCRVAAGGAQFILVQNLDGTMKEFYTLYEKVLAERQLFDEIKAMYRHIYEKRRPVSEMAERLEKNNFTDVHIDDYCFYLRFLDADAFFNHSFIRFWFCNSWREVVKPVWREEIFTELEYRLNRMAAEKGEIRLAVPYVVIDCRKK